MLSLQERERRLIRLSKKHSTTTEQQQRRLAQLQRTVDGDDTLHMVQQMLARERSLSTEFVVFYHSYSYSSLLYEMHAAISALLGLWTPRTRTDVPPPIPRLRRAPFLEIPSIEALRRALHPLEGDHAPVFRSAGLAASCSLFNGPRTEVQPLLHLQYGYSIMRDSDFELAVETLLNDCKIPADAMMGTLMQIAHKHKLPSWRDNPRIPRYGWMLQVCLRKDVAAEFSYAAEPYGWPEEEDDSIYDISYRQSQARLYLPPSLALDPTRCRLFAHSCNTVNRAEVLNDLTVALVGAGFDAEYARERFG